MATVRGHPHIGGQNIVYDYKNLTFREIVDEELEETLRSSCRVISIPKKKIFIAEGDNLDLLYFIRSGVVSLYMADRNGAEKNLYRLTRGWFFGEIVTQLGLKQTSLHFISVEDTVLYCMEEHQVAHLMENSRKFRNALLKCTCYKTIALRYEIENFTFYPTKSRLLKSLFRDVDASKLIDGLWYCLSEKRTHYELGVDVGATRVTISRLISELCCEGHLRTINNHIQFSSALYETMDKEMDRF